MNNLDLSGLVCAIVYLSRDTATSTWPKFEY